MRGNGVSALLVALGCALAGASSHDASPVRGAVYRQA